MSSLFLPTFMLLSGMPISTQISLAHSMVKMGVWSVKQAYWMFSYLRSTKHTNKLPDTHLLIMSLEKDPEHDFVVVTL